MIVKPFFSYQFNFEVGDELTKKNFRKFHTEKKEKTPFLPPPKNETKKNQFWSFNTSSGPMIFLHKTIKTEKRISFVTNVLFSTGKKKQLFFLVLQIYFCVTHTRHIHFYLFFNTNTLN